MSGDSRPRSLHDRSRTFPGAQVSFRSHGAGSPLAARPREGARSGPRAPPAGGGGRGRAVPAPGAFGRVPSSRGSVRPPPSTAPRGRGAELHPLRAEARAQGGGAGPPRPSGSWRGAGCGCLPPSSRGRWPALRGPVSAPLHRAPARVPASTLPAPGEGTSHWIQCGLNLTVSTKAPSPVDRGEETGCTLLNYARGLL